MRTADEMQELIALYSLDALEHAERLEVDAAVAADASLLRELDEMRAVAAALADAVEPATDVPSPAVWRGIQAEIATGRPAQPTGGRRWGIGTFMALAAVVIAVALAVRVGNLQRELDSVELTRLAEAKMTEPSAFVVTLGGGAGQEETVVEAVIGPDGVGYVMAGALPALPADRTYQLWAIVAAEPEPRVVSAGVLGNDPSVAPFQAVGEIVGLAITAEVAGGVPVSEGEPIAAWLADA